MNGVAEVDALTSAQAGQRIRPVRQDPGPWPRLGIALLYLLATLQSVSYYMIHGKSYFSIASYEDGTAPMPFQGRLLMVWLLRSVRHDRFLTAAAHGMSALYPWFPLHLKAESLVEAVINVGSIIFTGVIATRIYQAASPRALFTPFIYPLLLVIFTVTYAIHNTQNLRSTYDLPSLAFFSAGLYVIYFRKGAALFAALFLVGTMNRETTLLLLPCYALAYAAEGERLEPRKLFAGPVLRVVLPLAACWGAWHLFTFHHYAQNHSEYYARYLLNTGILLIPLAWPQFFSACAYLLPVVFLLRNRIHDPTLRAWMWLLPFWFFFMFRYGILIETRVFGELTAYIACAAALIAEQLTLEKLGLSADSASLP